MEHYAMKHHRRVIEVRCADLLSYALYAINLNITASVQR